VPVHDSARGAGGARYARSLIYARAGAHRAHPRARDSTGTLAPFENLARFLILETGSPYCNRLAHWAHKLLICLEKELMPGLFLCQVAGLVRGGSVVGAAYRLVAINFLQQRAHPIWSRCVMRFDVFSDNVLQSLGCGHARSQRPRPPL